MGLNQVNVRLTDAELTVLASHANDGESYSQTARRLLKELLGLSDGMDVHTRTASVHRVSELEARVANLEQVIQAQQCVQSVRSVPASTPAPTHKATSTGSESNQPSRADDLIDKSLLHPRQCAELLGLKYPSGWEGLAHRQGTEFMRDGYRFKRTEQRQRKAYLWSVERTQEQGTQTV